MGVRVQSFVYGKGFRVRGLGGFRNWGVGVRFSSVRFKVSKKGLRLGSVPA